MDYHANRRERLTRLLVEEGIDGLLVSNPVNVTYLTGFSGDSSALVLTPTRELAIQVAGEITRLARYRDLCILPIYGGQPYDHPGGVGQPALGIGRPAPRARCHLLAQGGRRFRREPAGGAGAAAFVQQPLQAALAE